ncbi:MAG: RNA-binding protein [Deltaproteobacteria bacterium]|nr:MAG: RNA-binding protein [Deltaproteobacteria bacterium]
MCESSVYIIRDGKEELLIEDVDLMEQKGDEIRVVNIFGEEKRVKARIKNLSLVDHKILLEPIS